MGSLIAPTTRVMAIVLKMSAAVAIHTIGRWIPTASVLTQSSRSSVISSTMTASGTPTLTAQNTVMRVVILGADALSGSLAIAATVIGRSTFSTCRYPSTHVTSAPIRVATAPMNAFFCDTARLVMAKTLPPTIHIARFRRVSSAGSCRARCRANSSSRRERRRCQISTGNDSRMVK